MGNKLGRRKQVVDEKYTRPQRLYVHKDVDIKKLRKLILESKLAPCYPGDEDCCSDLEECPICFLYYPSLNRSRCCMKSICTECFLQMKNPNSTRPTQYPSHYGLEIFRLISCLNTCIPMFAFLNNLRCPFCKTSSYAVEYRGVKTKEEKGIEQIEEQRVIEAQIRMRQQALQDDEERMLKRHERSSSSTAVAAGELQYNSVGDRSSGEEEIFSSQESPAASMIRQPSHPRTNRDDEFDLDLEELMVMEAVWQSIQENSRHRNSNYVDASSSVQYVSRDRYISPAMTTTTVAGSSSSPSGGFACAIAALAERQQTGGESSLNHDGNMPAFHMLPGSSSRFYSRLDPIAVNYPSADIPVGDGSMTPARDEGKWCLDHGSEGGEAGTSYSSAMPQEHEIRSSFENAPNPVPIIPESYEEQMMLAMAVSLAEARAMTSSPGIS